MESSLKKIGNRRKGREAALRMLYLCDNCKLTGPEALSAYLSSNELFQTSSDFAKELFEGTLNEQSALDTLIINQAKNWKIERMAVIDRNILRLAAYEIIYTPKTPINVIIDEAVEIAKTYSTPDSGKFVNGILDKLKESRTTLKSNEENTSKQTSDL